MSGIRYTDEFKIEAVKQVTDHGHPVTEEARRLGVSVHSLYSWKRRLSDSPEVRKFEQEQAVEVRHTRGGDQRYIRLHRDIL